MSMIKFSNLSRIVLSILNHYILVNSHSLVLQKYFQRIWKDVRFFKKSELLFIRWDIYEIKLHMPMYHKKGPKYIYSTWPSLRSPCITKIPWSRNWMSCDLINLRHINRNFILSLLHDRDFTGCFLFNKIC